MTAAAAAVTAIENVNNDDKLIEILYQLIIFSSSFNLSHYHRLIHINLIFVTNRRQIHILQAANNTD